MNPIKKFLIGRLLPNPTSNQEAQYSMILYDGNGRPNNRLIDVALESVKHARTQDLSGISGRITIETVWTEIWPGEHYKLLAGMVDFLQPKCVIEIGTFRGLSALAMKHALSGDGVIYTFDVVPYDRIEGHIFRDDDFLDHRLVQVIDDLTDPTVVDKHRAKLEAADLIFVDAAKDGRMEQMFLDNFNRLRFSGNPIVVFDDIRLWNMMKIWNAITRPKLDLTSFGHWSGTGLIDWNG